MEIIDNVLPEGRVEELHKYFTTNKWKFQHRSPTLRLQNMVLKHRGLKPIDYFPLARFPMPMVPDLISKWKLLYPDYTIYSDFVGVLMHPKDFSHTPHYDFFEDQYIGKQDQMKRILFYCVPEWKKEWGGNTEFYGRWKNEKDTPDICQIKPNRMCVFDWDEYHTGTPWDSDITRVVISGYLYKNVEPKVKDKMYKYIWGNSPTYSETFHTDLSIL
jgi:hypothetical protein|tara:strand:+ start:464 stop:1111 length:648 start_codon:yes stop_codon:yes gene_type:complete